MSLPRNRLAFALCALLLPFLLSGCWDIKSVQDVNYFTGIGVDFVDEQFVVYVQQLDFSSVAKTSGGEKSDKPSKSWVGRATGKSLSEAIMKLYESAQQTVFWGHLNTVVLSENMLKSGRLLELFDAMLRSPEIRLTPWVFGTKENISDVFSSYAFFYLSPLNTILYAPESSYKQKSVVMPIRLYRFMKEFRDPGCTLLLPSLAIARDTWMVNRKPDPKLAFSGVYAIREEKFRDWYSIDQILGLRWMNKANRTSRLILQREGRPLATLRVNRPRERLRLTVDDTGNVNARFDVRIRASMLELWQPSDVAQLEKAAAEQVRGEIEASMRESIRSRSDLFNIEHALYRKHYKLWDRLTRHGKIPFEYGRMPEIRVTVHLTDSGAYKLSRNLRTHD